MFVRPLGFLAECGPPASSGGPKCAQRCGTGPVFHRRELTLLASRNAHPSDFPKIIQLIEDKKINTDIWITHRITIDEVPEKFAQFTNPAMGAIKAIIEVR
jgi:threonine dehydrogenase-like Zn-dependent dehydrogenase